MYNKRIIAVVLAVVLCCSVCNKERAFHGYLKSYTCMKNAFDKLVIIAINCYYYYKCTKHDNVQIMYDGQDGQDNV